VEGETVMEETVQDFEISEKCPTCGKKLWLRESINEKGELWVVSFCQNACIIEELWLLPSGNFESLRKENEELKRRMEAMTIACEDNECGEFEAAMNDWKHRAEQAEAREKQSDRRRKRLYSVAMEQKAKLAIAVEALESNMRDWESFVDVSKPMLNMDWYVSRVTHTNRKALAEIREW